MNISKACEQSRKAAQLSRDAQDDIVGYCNSYAKKVLNNPEFEFTSLPDDIVETLFYGSGAKPKEGWSKYLKNSINNELDRYEYEKYKRK